MRTPIEMVVAAVVVLSLVLITANTVVFSGSPLTREEAIEISGNTPLVRSLLEQSDHYGINALYTNRTESNKAREEFPANRERYPSNRSIWTIFWMFRVRGTVNSFGSVVTHIVDGETGQIWYEEEIGTFR